VNIGKLYLSLVHSQATVPGGSFSNSTRLPSAIASGNCLRILGTRRIKEMPFSEKIKFEVKRKSHQTCCICRQIGIEIHHIIPQSEKGSDLEENAAPLCPSCHELYGANPTKRKFIRESKEIWFEACAQKYPSESFNLKNLAERIESIEEHLGLTKEKLYSSIDKSQPYIHEATEEQQELAGVLNGLISIPTPSIEDSDQFVNFHVTYLLVFETEGDSSEHSVRFNFIRDKFLKVFGRFIAEKIILHQMKVYEIDWRKGITESIANIFIMACKMFMLSILGVENKDRSSELYFTPDEQSVIDSLIAQNKSR
jgi:5-methylcytosine-specific restriction endonuclease McrA